VTRQIVSTTDAPDAIGPYSLAVRADVVRTSCFLVSVGQFPAFNEVYGRFFPSEPPARETVQVARLPKDALVEVSAVCRVAG
jgi:enamine deaminase RidA (YjgF/YER057c/UK114 family)